VLFVVGRHADEETYQALHRLAHAETSTEEKRRLYGALAASLDPKHADRTLALSITTELPPQGATRLVQAVGDDGEQPAAAWNFAKQNLGTLMALLPSIRSYGYAPSLFTAFADDARAEELAAFAREKLPPESEYEVAKAIDEIRYKAEMKKRVLPEITAWCRAHL
jgi:aminopeptidase N